MGLRPGFGQRGVESHGSGRVSQERDHGIQAGGFIGLGLGRLFQERLEVTMLCAPAFSFVRRLRIKEQSRPLQRVAKEVGLLAWA